jgi:hypothetical protein
MSSPSYSWVSTGASRYLFGWIFPASKVSQVVGYSISGTTTATLLPSCHDLVVVELWNIPNTGYISPEAMVTALSALTKLNFVDIEFKSPASRPDPTNRPPSSFTRVVLPALTSLEFHGASEYFEDLVARINTPAIISVETRFFNPIEFDIPYFLQFIGRTQIPGSFEEAELCLSDVSVYIHVGHRDPLGGNRFRTTLPITILCPMLNRQVGHLAQICGKISPFLSNVKRLLIRTSYFDTKNGVPSDWKDYPHWLEIFHSFSALQHVRISPKLGEIIASALLELTGERVMDTLPMLRHLYLDPRSASIRQAIEPFISSRQRCNHPVTVHITEIERSLD